MFFPKFIGARLIQMRKTTEIQVSHSQTPRIADSEIKAECLSMSYHSDILLENQKCQDFKNQNAQEELP